MSDLQCPAQVWFVAPDMLESLPVPCAGVFVAGDAGSLAADPGCPVEMLADVADATALARAVNELSDSYRGETIVVIATRELIRDVLDRTSVASAPVVVAIDSSGWSAISEPKPG